MNAITTIIHNNTQLVTSTTTTAANTVFAFRTSTADVRPSSQSTQPSPSSTCPELVAFHDAFNPNIHLPHFHTTCAANSSPCNNCFCYVCDVPFVTCSLPHAHAKASDARKVWRVLRRRLREKRQAKTYSRVNHIHTKRPLLDDATPTIADSESTGGKPQADTCSPVHEVGAKRRYWNDASGVATDRENKRAKQQYQEQQHEEQQNNINTHVVSSCDNHKYCGIQKNKNNTTDCFTNSTSHRLHMHRQRHMSKQLIETGKKEAYDGMPSSFATWRTAIFTIPVAEPAEAATDIQTEVTGQRPMSVLEAATELYGQSRNHVAANMPNAELEDGEVVMEGDEVEVGCR